jgi:hypothetical protein
VVTPFGALRVNARDGRCVVRLSSEDLAADPAGTPATIVNSHFFGHDVVDEVRIDDGRVFRVRAPQSSGAIGDRLGVKLQARRVRVFLADGAVFAEREESA